MDLAKEDFNKADETEMLRQGEMAADAPLWQGEHPKEEKGEYDIILSHFNIHFHYNMHSLM